MTEYLSPLGGMVVNSSGSGSGSGKVAVHRPGIVFFPKVVNLAVWSRDTFRGPCLSPGNASKSRVWRDRAVEIRLEATSWGEEEEILLHVAQGPSESSIDLYLMVPGVPH